MQIVRRPSLTEPGEALLLTRSAIEAVARFHSFIAEFGIPADYVLSSTLTAIPLPVYTNFGTLPNGRPRRRWEGTKAEAMWHPLMWLPRRLAGRYRYSDPATGLPMREDDDLWAIRLGFELTASGLYDPESGTWVDILATVDLDINDDLDLARIEDWLDGEPDSILDSIDLSEYLDLEPSDWGIQTALAMRGELEEASWALIADDLLDMADHSSNPDRRLDPVDSLQALRSLTALAETLLGDVPAINEYGIPTGVDTEGHGDFFRKVHDMIDPSSAIPAPQVADAYFDQSRQRLHAIREAYWPSLEHVTSIAEDPAEPAPV